MKFNLTIFRVKLWFRKIWLLHIKKPHVKYPFGGFVGTFRDLVGFAFRSHKSYRERIHLKIWLLEYIQAMYFVRASIASLKICGTSSNHAYLMCLCDTVGSLLQNDFDNVKVGHHYSEEARAIVDELFPALVNVHNFTHAENLPDVLYNWGAYEWTNGFDHADSVIKRTWIRHYLIMKRIDELKAVKKDYLKAER